MHAGISGKSEGIMLIRELTEQIEEKTLSSFAQLVSKSKGVTPIKSVTYEPNFNGSGSDIYSKAFEVRKTRSHLP